MKTRSSVLLASKRPPDMATYLITVETAEAVASGLRLTPGIRPSEMENRPSINSMMQGAPLELRRPNGSVQRTSLLTYGVSVWKGEDGSLQMNDDPADPEIRLTLPADVESEHVPAGTELWLLDE